MHFSSGTGTSPPSATHAGRLPGVTDADVCNRRFIRTRFRVQVRKVLVVVLDTPTPIGSCHNSEMVSGIESDNKVSRLPISIRYPIV